MSQEPTFEDYRIRGEEILKKLYPDLRSHEGRIIAINLDNEEFILASDYQTASEEVRRKYPNNITYISEIKI